MALFTLPALGHLIGLSDHEFGLWAGLAVDNTAETTATGYLFSDEAGKIAVLVKSTRNALIGFVVLGFALYWAARGEADQIAPGFKARAGFVWDKFPKFVLGFLAVSAIATAGWLSKGQLTNLANVSKWAFLLTFAGVGLEHQFPGAGANRVAPTGGGRHRTRRRRGRLPRPGVADVTLLRLGYAYLTAYAGAGVKEPR